MWELYVSPDLLSDNEWNAIAPLIKWAKANKTVLQKTKMILGDPLKREPYGYIHLKNDAGILLLRNPGIDAREVIIKLTPELGDIDPSAKYFVKIIYPYNMILPEPVEINRELKIHLNGCEILTAELIPESKINGNLPLGVKYSINGNGLNIYGEAGKHENVKTINSNISNKIDFPGKEDKIKFSESAPLVNSGSMYESTVNIIIPANIRNPKFAFLLEPDSKLQNELKPQFEIILNGVSQKLQVEEENGKWFWALSDLKSGRNSVDYKIKFKDKIHGKISSWIFADQELMS